MSSIDHLAHNLLDEQAGHRSPSQLPPDMAPPPYSEANSDIEDNDDDDDDREDAPSPSPMSLVINAVHNIRGSNNLVPTSPNPMADASKVSALLIHALNQANTLNRTALNTTVRHGQRPLKIDLTINCGITIVGDRNVVGNVGLKPRAPSAVNPGIGGDAVAVATVKRKVELAAADAAEPMAKKLARGDGRE